MAREPAALSPHVAGPVAGARRTLAARWRWLSWLNPRLWGLAILVLLLHCLGDRSFVAGRAPGWHDDRDGA